MVEGPGEGRYALHGEIPATAPVGSFPDGQSVYGLHDVAGNVWEWVSDWHAPYAADVVEEPKGPETGEARVVQGPEERSHGVGFRCAK